MDSFNEGVISFFDFVLKPFEGQPPFFGLVFISFIAGILLFKLFGLFSPQNKIRAIKSKIQAHILEIVLYQNNLRLSLGAILKTLGANLVYMKYVLVPLAVLFIPSLVILAQLQLRYNNRPLQIGEEVVVRVKAAPDSELNDLSLKASTGLEIVGEPLKMKSENEVNWVIKAVEKGKQSISIESQSQTYPVDVYVGIPAAKIPNGRFKEQFKTFLYPGQRMITSSSTIEEIMINYPSLTIAPMGLQTHWLVVFLCVSLLSGFAFKNILGVEI